MQGRYLIWDITYVADTTAISYLPTTAITASSAVELAATRKLVKYKDLLKRYAFVPIIAIIIEYGIDRVAWNI